MNFNEMLIQADVGYVNIHHFLKIDDLIISLDRYFVSLRFVFYNTWTLVFICSVSLVHLWPFTHR